jgi:hypothetical protein
LPEAFITLFSDGWPMPRELKSKDEFEKMLESALEVRVLKEDDTAKIKLRTAVTLYTFKTTPEEADSLVKGVKVPVLEL